MKSVLFYFETLVLRREQQLRLQGVRSVLPAASVTDF
jgi:hypothetical protein